MTITGLLKSEVDGKVRPFGDLPKAVREETLKVFERLCAKMSVGERRRRRKTVTHGRVLFFKSGNITSCTLIASHGAPFSGAAARNVSVKTPDEDNPVRGSTIALCRAVRALAERKR